MKNKQEILTIPIHELPVSDEIRDICRQHGFKNLEELLKVSDYEMIHNLGFSYHAVIDLFGYLQSVGLEDLIENPDNKIWSHG
jgi:hypothetical protein